MTSNPSEFERRMMEKKSETVLRCLAEEIEKLRAAELDQVLIGAEQEEVPVELHQKLLKMVETEKLERKRKQRNARMKSVIKVCACLLIGVAVIGTFLVTNVEAVREKVYRLFYQEEKDYVQMTPTEIPYNPDNLIPEDWEGFWYPSYLPEGYELVYTDALGEYKTLIFENGESRIKLEEAPANELNVALDNSEGPPEKVNTKFGEAFYMKSGEWAMLNWTDHEMVFLLYAHLSEEELIKIAESLTYQKNN